MNKVVFDSSVLLALLQEEPGYKIAEKYLSQAIMSTINVSEIVLVLTRRGMKETLITKSIESLIFEIVNFDLRQAYQTAMLADKTKKYGLSFGDRACMALGMHYGIPIITADRVWGKVDINTKVILIR